MESEGGVFSMTAAFHPVASRSLSQESCQCMQDSLHLPGPKEQNVEIAILDISIKGFSVMIRHLARFGRQRSSCLFSPGCNRRQGEMHSAVRKFHK